MSNSDHQSWLDLRPAFLAWVLFWCCVWFAIDKASAEELRLTCKPPTLRTNEQAITSALTLKFHVGTQRDALNQIVSVPPANGCRATVDVPDPAPGQQVTYYIGATATENGSESPMSAVISKTLVGKPPEQRLVVVEPAVYNTGGFDISQWLVRRNKLYGTVPLGTECIATLPAAGGYYRVPATAVRWTVKTSRTPNPLAKCERRP